MNKHSTIETKIDQELENAQLARQKGNEGMARVCARRAAGIAVRYYFIQTTKLDPKESPFEILRSFSELPNIPSEINKLTKNLTMQVSKSFELPDGIDLIDDANKLCNYLLKFQY